MWPRTEFDTGFALAIAKMQMVLGPGDGEIKGRGLVDSDEQVMMAGIGTIHTRRRHPPNDQRRRHE